LGIQVDRGDVELLVSKVLLLYWQHFSKVLLITQITTLY